MWYPQTPRRTGALLMSCFSEVHSCHFLSKSVSQTSNTPKFHFSGQNLVFFTIKFASTIYRIDNSTTITIKKRAKIGQKMTKNGQKWQKYTVLEIGTKWNWAWLASVFKAFTIGKCVGLNQILIFHTSPSPLRYQLYLIDGPFCSL